jgi:hypothetical protein
MRLIKVAARQQMRRLLRAADRRTGSVRSYCWQDCEQAGLSKRVAAVFAPSDVLTACRDCCRLAGVGRFAKARVRAEPGIASQEPIRRRLLQLHCACLVERLGMLSLQQWSGPAPQDNKFRQFYHAAQSVTVYVFSASMPMQGGDEPRQAASGAITRGLSSARRLRGR